MTDPKRRATLSGRERFRGGCLPKKTAVPGKAQGAECAAGREWPEGKSAFPGERRATRGKRSLFRLCRRARVPASAAEEGGGPRVPGGGSTAESTL